MQLNKQILRRIEADVLAALTQVASRHEVEFKFSGGSFDDHNATLKLEILAKREDGSVISKDAEYFKMNAKWYGINPTALGQKFTFNGLVYSISGLKPRSGKFPILAVRADGKIFKFQAQSILQNRPDLKFERDVDFREVDQVKAEEVSPSEIWG